LGTGKNQHITITAPNKLKKEDVERYIRDAEKYAEEDKKRRQEVELRNEADSALYACEKALKEHGDKISQDDRLALERANSELKEALKGSDMERIAKAKDEVLKASHKLAETLYKEAQSRAQSGPEAGTGTDGKASGKPKEGQVVDAEIVDDKDKET